MLRPRKKNSETAQVSGKQEAIVLPLHSVSRSLDFLSELVDKVRPSNPKNIKAAEANFKVVLYQLSQDKTILFSFRKALLTQILNTNIVNALTENGIVSSRGFVQELTSKIKHKFLPDLHSEDNFLHIINKVFYKRTDYLWVEGVDEQLWVQFFEILGIQVNITEPLLKKQLLQALQILSYRIATLGLEKEMTHRYENFDDAVYPFIEQNRLINEYIHSDNLRPGLTDDIEEALYNCNQSIQWIKEQREQYGTSLAQTFILTRLQQQISRVFILLEVLDEEYDFDVERFVDYFKTIVHNENRKNSVREFLSENTSYLAYQIAEHGGRKGEKYITTTSKEFWKMFRSALGGGIIISFIGVIKNLLTKMKFAPFWQGFLYSCNYSLGFILIQDTGSTLATKQPAYTANNVASSLDIHKIGERPD